LLSPPAMNSQVPAHAPRFARASRSSILAAALAAGALALPAHAAPITECRPDADELGALVATLGGVLGAPDATGRYGALGDIADPDVLAKNAATISPSERDRMASELLGLLHDEKLAQATDCSEKRVRYNAEGVLAALAANAPATKKQAILDAIAASQSGEKDPSLRRQMALDLARLGSTAPAAKTAIGEALPDAPPYDAIFGADGAKNVVHVDIHSGAESFQTAGYAGVFRKLGATITRHSEYDWTIHYTVTPDDPTGKLKPVTYEIHMKDEVKDDFANLDMFRNMDKSSPEIEMYDYHSQYGSALDESLADAAKNPDAQKLVLLAACKSKVFASRVQGLYPKSHFITTEDGEYFTDTPQMLARVLQGLANRETYPQMHRALVANQLTNYHLPNDRAQWDYVDLDGDGVADSRDTLLACGGVKTRHENTFKPATPAGSRLEMNGEKVLHAVTVANGVMGYNLQVGPKWEDKFVSDGWGEADPNGPIATYTPAGGGTYKVRVNAAYSHLSDLALGTALTNDFTLFASTDGGTKKPTLDDKIRAFETGLDLLGAWDDQGTFFDTYQKHFDLGGKPLDYWKASAALSHEDGCTPDTIEKIKKMIGPTTPQS